MLYIISKQKSYSFPQCEHTFVNNFLILRDIKLGWPGSFTFTVLHTIFLGSFVPSIFVCGCCYTGLILVSKIYQGEMKLLQENEKYRNFK